MGAYEYQAIPNAPLLAIHLDADSLRIYGGTYALITNNNYRLIAHITPNGTTPITGITKAKVWVETSQSAAFVNRHYEINRCLLAGY